MRRILIVEQSDILVRVMTKDCQPDDEILCCADGITALRMLAEFQPDVLAINMSLPYKTGMDVLMESVYLPPQIVACSYVTNPYVVRVLGMLGVQCILHMPTAGSFRRAMALAENMHGGIRPDLRQRVTEHLRQLGIAPNLDGYKMLLVGLPLLFQDPDQLLVKELYPAVADAVGKVSPAAVEKAIRDTITKAWQRRNDSVWEQYFPRNGRGQISNPTNNRFLKVLVHRLQQEMKK